MSAIALTACQGARDAHETHATAPQTQVTSGKPACEPVHVAMFEGQEPARVALPESVYVPGEIAEEVVETGKIAVMPTLDVCVDESGAPTAGRFVKSSGFPALDQWVMGSLLHVETSAEVPTGAPGCARVVLVLRRFECYWPPAGTSTARP